MDSMKYVHNYSGCYSYSPINEEYVDFTLCPTGMYFIRHNLREIEPVSDLGWPPLFEYIVDSGRYEIGDSLTILFFSMNDEIRYRFKIIDTLNLQISYSSDSLFYEGDFIQRRMKFPVDGNPNCCSYYPQQYIWEIWINFDEDGHLCMHYKWKGNFFKDKKVYEKDTEIMLSNDVYKFNKRE
jgi:hypothetical protein